MRKKNPPPPDLKTLRRRAEARLKKRRTEAAGSGPQGEVRPRTHEQQVHQLELEMQNEELQAVHAELAANYAELYDFAPVNYFTLSRGSRIRKLNVTAASLLQTERAQLIGHRLADFIAEESRTAFRDFLKKVFAGQGKETCAVALRPVPGAAARWLQIQAVAGASGQDCRAVAMDITERIRAEEELREREGQLRLFAEHAPAAVAMLDRQMRYVAVSQRWREDYGLAGQELLGRSHYEIFPDLPERWKKIHRRCLAGAVERAEEDCFARADGSRQWLRWEVRPWQAASGTIGGIVIFSEDITARKQAEEALRASEGRAREQAQELATLLEAMPTPVIIVHDPEARHMTGNRAADELLQQPRGAEASLSAPAEVRPRHFKALKEGRELRLDELPAQRAARGEYVRDFEFSLAFDDGTVRELLGYGTPLLDAAGRPRGAVHVLFDITARKQAEAGLRASEERFRVAQELSLDAFTILRAVRDDNGRIVDFCWVYVNPEAGRVLRHTPQELVGQRLLKYLPGNKANSDLFEQYVRVVESGEPHDYELPYESDGIRGWFRNMTVKLQDGIAVCFTDITERKRTEESLRQSEERLRLVLQASSMGTFEVDLRTGEGCWNDTEFELLGLKPGSTQPNPETFFRYVHPEDLELVRAQWEKALKVGKLDEEFRIVRADGQIRWVAGRGEFIFEGEDNLPPVRGQALRFLGVNFDITARKQAEREILALNERLKALMDAVPVGISFSEDTSCQRITGNPAALAQFEVGGQDNLSASAPDAAAPGRQVTFLRDGHPIADTELPLQRAVAENQVIAPMELEVVLSSGRRWYAAASAAPVCDAQGQVVGGIAVTMDITARKRAEEQVTQALRESRQHASETEAVLAAINDAVLVYDADMNVVRVNPGFIPVYGFDPTGLNVRDIIARTRCRTLDGNPLAFENQPTPRARRGETVTNQLFRITRLDGQERVLETSATPLLLGDRIVGTVTVWHDCTERRQAEEIVQQKETQLREAQRIARLGSWVWDVRTDATSGSDELLRIYGFDPATQSMPAFNDQKGRCYPVADWERIRAAVQNTLATGIGYELDVQVIRNGVPIWVTTRGEAVRDAEGRITALRGTVQDITERKQIEEVQAFLAQTSSAAPGEDFFQVLARYLAQTLDMDFICIDRLEGDGLTARTVAVWCDGQFKDNVTYALKDTPCGDVVGKQVCCFPASVGRFFPRDQVLQDLRAESYTGVTLWDHAGKPIGLIAGIGRQPLTNHALIEATLKLVAGRAAAELERQAAEAALRASETRYRTLFATMQEGFYLARTVGDDDDRPSDFMYLDVNPAFEQIMGRSRDQIIGRRAKELIPDIKPDWLEVFSQVERTGVPARYDSFSAVFQRHFEALAFRPAPGQFAVLVTDVTERRRAEQERDATAEFMRLVNESSSLEDLSHKTVAFFRQHSGCQTVGLRLKDGDDYPYYETCGFSEEFVQTETHLCARDGAGRVLRNSAGRPVLECMCGKVISGGVDPALPFFTAHGSYWTNSTTELRTRTRETEQQARARNRCNGEGYESVALLPLRLGNERLGLLQLNDRRTGMFSAQLMALWERLTDKLAVAVAKFRAEEEVKRLNRDLQRRLTELETVLATVPVGIAIVDDPQGRHIHGNPTLYQLIGAPADQELSTRVAQPFAFCTAGDPHGLSPEDLPMHRAVRGERVTNQVMSLVRTDGQELHLHCCASPVLDEAGQPRGAIGAFVDITESKRAEAELRQLNRTLRALNESYQSMLRATTETDFLEGTCRIMVEVCGHAMVWIGFAEEDAQKTVRPVAQAGFEEGYLETLRVTWADSERGRGPTGMAIRTGQPATCRNMRSDPAFAPWREEALKRGYASSLVLPLLEGGKAFGAVTIYARQADAFTPEEIKLLSKLAGDLAYGITALRLRQAHTRAEAALLTSEKRYRSLFENMLDGFAYCQMMYENDQPCDFIYLEVNNAFEHLTGLKNVVGKKVSEVIPNIRKTDPQLLEIYGRVAQTGRPERMDFFVEALGAWFSIAVYCPQRGYFAAVFDNITSRKQAETALHANRELLNSVIEGTSDCVSVKDVEGRYLLMNAAAARLTGRNASDIIGRDDFYLFPSAEAEMMKANDQTVFAAGHNLTYEESIPGVNGEHHTYYTTKGVLRDGHGNPTGLFVISRDITELKRTQDKLAWLASFPELDPMPITEVDLASGTVHYFNPTARHLFPDLETRGLNHPWLAGVESLAQPLTGDPTGVVQREVVLDGAYFEQSLNWVAETRRVRVYGLNITKRKQALEALRESEERYRSLFNSMTEGFALHEIICDPTGRPCDYRFLDINPSFERLTGLQRAAVAGRTVRQVLPEEDPKWIKSYGEVALTGQAVHFENYSPALKKFFEVYAYCPARGQFAVIFMDITERKTIERALQESEEQAWDRLMEIETVYNTAPVGLCVLDRELKFRRINGRMAEITGRPIHYHLDRSFREVLPDLANEAEPLLRQVMRTGQPVLDLEMTGETSSMPGITRTWKESLYPLRNFAGEITGINIVILEITEEKRAQERVRRLNEDLEHRVVERTTQLTKTMSALRLENAERKRAHERLEIYQQDLRRLANQVVVAEEMERRRLARDLHDGPCQVLALVRMQLGSLRRAIREPRSLDTLVEAGQHLEQAIQTMRSLMLELSPPVLHELGLVAAVRWLAEDLHHRYGLKVQVDADEQTKLVNDQLNILLFRCVRELLINVAKHARVPESRVTIRHEPDGLRLRIADDGVGFDPGQTSARVEATTAGGFGLFSIGEQLTPLGGCMDVKSSPGQGTTVSLWLPLADDQYSPAPATNPETDGRPATDPG